jgi:rhodanese-related sulfurtransferase
VSRRTPGARLAGVPARAVAHLRAADIPEDLGADGLLLDVREQDEFDAGHAPAAVHIPLHELPHRLSEVLASHADDRVVVICKVGSRSAYGAAFLAAHGVEAVNVADGMLGWARDGRRLVSETGDPPAII